METILYLAHTEADGSLGKAALESLTAAAGLAAQCGGTLVAGLVGQDVQAAANQVAGAGFSKVLGVCGEAFAQARYSTDAAAAEALCQAADATIVVAAGDSRWSRVLPGVGQRLGGRADLHITQASGEGGVSVKRWFYRQRMEGSFSREQRPWLLGIDPGTQAAWQGDAGEAAVEAVSVDASGARTTVTGVKAPDTDEQTIRPDAAVLFVAGAGWTKKQADGQTHLPEAAGHILGFLKAAKASLGSSKSLVDLSSEGGEVLPFMTHLNQVGQTGATPRHAKGLSTCCHGEEPHVVGWRFINERRAVNLDANCGWAQGKADVLYVADAFEVMQKVNALLGE